MRQHDIGGLPVVENGKLVGIITESDIFDALIDIMGIKDQGYRLAIDYSEDKPGELARIAGIIAGYGINISHLAFFKREIVIRVNTLNVDTLVKGLADNGYKVISVLKNDHI
jgi:acetoin utilization protein AcuB